MTQGVAFGSAKLLQVSLGYQSLDVPLSNVELAVLSQVDNPMITLVNVIIQKERGRVQQLPTHIPSGFPRHL